MIEIRTIKRTDLEYVFGLVDPLKWGYFPRDFERMRQFDPNGCLLAIYEDRPAGFLMSSRYGQYAFIGPMVVEEKVRGRKIGENLMIAAVDYLKSNEVESIELDAVFGAVSLYRRLGFKDKYFSYRMRRKVNVSGSTPEKFTPGMMDEIIDFDWEMTGLCRNIHLRQFCEEFPDSIYILKSEKLDAYTLMRERKGDLMWVGPLIASSAESAIKLFEKILATYSGNTIALGVPETSRQFIEYLRTTGFIHTIPALRMFYGKKIEYEQNVYGIIGPEKG